MTNIRDECILLLRCDSTDSAVISMLIDESLDYFKFTISNDFDIANGYERSLLKNRVRYAYNNVLEDFIHNFINEIESLQVKYAKTTQDV